MSPYDLYYLYASNIVYFVGSIKEYITCIVQLSIVRCVIIFQVNVRIFYGFTFTKFTVIFKFVEFFCSKLYTVLVYVNKIVNTVFFYKIPQNINEKEET